MMAPRPVARSVGTADLVRQVQHLVRYRQRPSEPGLYLLFHDGSELVFHQKTFADVEQGPTGFLVKEPELTHFFAYSSIAFAYVEH